MQMWAKLRKVKCSFMRFYDSFSVRPKCDWLIGTQKRPTSPIPPATATHTDATSMATSRSSFSSRVPSVPCRSLPYVAVSKLNVSRFPSLCCLLWLFLFKFSLAHYISFDSFFFFFFSSLMSIFVVCAMQRRKSRDPKPSINGSHAFLPLTSQLLPSPRT